ncbi:MAG: type II toxin-antitoxin system RelE/ParE family toxin [Geobacteraceae bacterium]|nr:type II toxin-antitoxin system RelE/ParE family toxin [Geobacteraceae bacterium]
MKIEWAEPALLDLEGIRDYIRKDSEYYARRFVEKIVAAVEKLAKFPGIGRHVPEADDETIRELIFRDYRIMYRLEQRRVLVLTVIHGARDLEQREIKPWEVV